MRRCHLWPQSPGDLVGDQRCCFGVSDVHRDLVRPPSTLDPQSPSNLVSSQGDQTLVDRGGASRRRPQDLGQPRFDDATFRNGVAPTYGAPHCVTRHSAPLPPLRATDVLRAHQSRMTRFPRADRPRVGRRHRRAVTHLSPALSTDDLDRHQHHCRTPRTVGVSVGTPRGLTLTGGPKTPRSRPSPLTS